MPDLTPEQRSARLAEQLRLLTVENEFLAERAEQTMLLGLIAEQVNAESDAGAVIAASLERMAVVSDLDFAVCCTLEGDCARVEQSYSPASDPLATGEVLRLEPELAERLRVGHVAGSGDGSRLERLGAALLPGYRTDRMVALPLSVNGETRRFLWLARNQDAGDMAPVLPLLQRAAEMIAARIENIDLLERLTALNLQLDQRVLARTRELAASELRTRTLFERAFDAFYVVDDDFVIRDVNTQACASLGYERQELLGTSMSRIPVDTDALEMKRNIALSAQGDVQTIGSVHRRKDGSTFEVEVRIGPIEIEGQRLTLAEVRDVSEQNRLQEQLLQAQKMEAVGRLAGGVAHDFNNVLTAILGQTEMLRLELGQDHRAGPDLDLIQAACERATGLIRQLLSFSRSSVLGMTPLSLTRCVADSSRLLTRVVDETVDLQFDLSADSCHVFGDAARIEQMLMNLVINARDALPDGGSIRVATAVVPACNSSPPAASADGVGTGRQVVLSVEDNGTGIPAEILERIFDPFFTTKAAGKGTGLGLSMVYGLAKQQRAEVRVRSTVGQGTVFEVVFPEVAASPDAAAVVDHEPTRGAGETVLLAEDDPATRQILSRMLKKLGYRVLAADDGLQALALAEAHAEAVHLLLSDVMMPQMGGLELARRLRATRPELRVICMSGYAEDLAGWTEIEQFGCRFLQKPISMQKLAAAVHSQLNDVLER